MNTDQTNYVASLSYDFQGADLSSKEFSANFRQTLAECTTVQELIDAIRVAHCFGVKDSLIVALLADNQ